MNWKSTFALWVFNPVTANSYIILKTAKICYENQLTIFHARAEMVAKDLKKV